MKTSTVCRVASVLFLSCATHLVHADVTISSGQISTIFNQGSWASTISMQGSNLAINASGAAPVGSIPSIITSGAAATAATFNPAAAVAVGGSFPAMTVVFSGTTYTDLGPQYIVLNMTFTGSPATVPNNDVLFPQFGEYEVSVSDLPFSMTGTATIHSGSAAGPVTLSIPISGSGVYSGSAAGDALNIRSGNTYKFLSPASGFSLDAMTHGAWSTKYGSDGYFIANGASHLPSYASISFPGTSTFTWAGQTNDPRALQDGPGSASGIASSVYGNYGANFDINVSLTDGLTHQVALYLLDWDTTSRVETITLRDASTNAVIDTELLSGFNGGLYAIWNAKGNVTFNVAKSGGANPVVSGLFFGPATGATTPSASFALSATSPVIGAGSSGSSALTVTPLNGFSSAVTLATAFWPAGITGTFGTNPTSTASNVTINVASNVSAGNYVLTINGVGGNNTRSTVINLTVTAPQGFTLFPEPAPAATPGSSTYSRVSLISQNGFNSPVTLATTNWPAGITGSFGTNPISNLNSNSPITIVVAFAVAPGTYPLTVTGTSGALTANTVISLTVNAPVLPSLTISASNASIPAGSSGISTLTETPAPSGGQFDITLDPVSWPAGITFGGRNNFNVTINVASSVAPGIYQLNVTGARGLTGVSAIINLTVTPGSSQGLTVSAAPVTIAAGSTGVATLTETPAPPNGIFDLNLDFPAWPKGISYTYFPSGSNFTLGLSVASFVTPGTYSLPISASKGGLTASTNISLLVTAGPALTSSVTFTGLDNATHGAWTSKYGADGYLIANGLTSLPGYSSVSVTGAPTFTWAQQTTDPRALQSGPGSSTGIAASYYGNVTSYTPYFGPGITPISSNVSNFKINLNLTDGVPHQIALYLLDWENAGRNQTISIADAATGTVLYQDDFSGFSGGNYAVWNIKGNVVISVASRLFGANAVFSGIFLAPVSGSPATPGFTLSATAATITAGSTGNSTLSVIPANGFNGQVGFAASAWPAGITGTFVGSTVTINVASNVAPGPYNLAVVGTSGALTANTTIPLAVNAAGQGSPVTFTGLDIATRGAWIGKYGTNGYLIANGPSVPPSYAGVSVNGAFTYTWAGETTSTRALQLSAGSPLGIASAYTQYPNSSFNISINPTDSATHSIALYLLDWDSARTETITILDAATNATLDTQTFSSFPNGQYATWSIRGNVIVKITPANGSSAVVSGVFFN